MEKRILLFGLAPIVRNVLNLTHLNRLFEIFDTEVQALQAASPKS
jgi:anti-anti-sigma regulatory factor